MSYASIAGGGPGNTPKPAPASPSQSSGAPPTATQPATPHVPQQSSVQPDTTSTPTPHQPRPRRPSQTPRPNPFSSSSSPESFYILTLRTTPQLRDAITSLRKKHFPKHLNKLDAHIALFRALPGSEMERIEHDIAELCGKTRCYEVGCGEGDVFLLGRAKAMLEDRANGAIAPQHNDVHAQHNKASPQDHHHQRQREQQNHYPPSGGVALTLSHNAPLTRSLHRTLLTPWRTAGFLSQQDQGGFKPHYTIQNKENDGERIERCVRDVETWVGEGGEETRGWATGLELWRYDRGWWVWIRGWDFVGAEEVG